MHVTYAFVYYFTILLIVATVLLASCAIKSVRKFFFGIIAKMKLFENQFFIAAVCIAFAVILIILTDSVVTYLSMKNELEVGN